MSRAASDDGRRWLVPAALAVARRPRLWATAVTQIARLAEPGWWRRPPHLPLPPAAYLSFRLVTAYGDGGAPAPADVVSYLGWCRQEQRRRPGRVSGRANAQARALAGR